MALTEAESVWLPEALLATVAITVTVAVPVLAIGPSVQLTPLVVEQVPCDGEAETTVRPGGSESSSWAAVAVSGPLFVRVNV